MAAFILSPERWRELSTASSPVAAVSDGQQQTPQAVGAGIRRRISRVFYEAHHTPVSSPVALNLHHHLPAGGVELADAMDVAEDEDLAAAAGVIAAHVERFLPQRRSPGQRSQDSGFSGYSGDSASEGSAASSNNSPVPAASGSSNVSPAISAGKRSPLSDPDAIERALLAEPAGPRVLETDLDAATPARLHVSRIYIQGTSATDSTTTVANLNLRDVLCEKNIQPVNLSGTPESSSTSPDKCVGDKSPISVVLANNQTTTCVHGRNNNNNHEADRSSDSQTALLLEHKSIVPPSSMRPNLSWKKLSESFRRVISSGRMMTATTTTSSHSCLPSVADGDESFTDEEKSRMLLLGKRSNLRRMKMDNEQHQQQLNGDKEEEDEAEEGRNCANRVTVMTESPQPTSRYLGGPRSSTPRKTLPAEGRNHRRTAGASIAACTANANANQINNNNKQRQCSRFNEDRPRVHWADIDPVVNSNDVLADGRRKQPQRPVNSHLAAVVTSWPDNSTWDSDTPSLEIGQQVVASHPPTVTPQLAHQPAATLLAGGPLPVEQRKIRRGLRMGVGVDRSLNCTAHNARKPIPPQPVVAPAVNIHPHPVIIPAPAEFRSILPHQQQPSPTGLRWSPVEAWLKDLPMFYQPESTCALQNKAIQQQQQQLKGEEQQQRRSSSASWMTDDSASSADGSSALLSLHHQSDDEDRTYSMTVTARAQVRRLQRRAHLISTEFAQLCSFIELYEEAKLASLIPLFLAHVIQFIREAEMAVLSDSCGQMESKRTEGSEELIQSLRQTCTQLVQIVTFSARPLYMMTSEPSLMLDAGVESVPLPLPVNWSLARQITAKLGQVFVSIVDTFVGREIEVLTAALKSGKCVSAAKLAANSLMSLGADAARPALRPLIEAFQVVHLRPVRADLLRALAALCSSADIIQEFETCAGLTVVFDILCNPRSQADCEEKSEAAGLLAQITSPWLDPPMEDPQVGICGTNGDLQPNPNGAWPTLHLTPYISSFIAALTELSSQTETEETLLLSTAALANLTFSHSEAVQLMAKYRTAQVLVQASGLRKDLSVFIQDQIATILANMAAVYSARAELVSHGALVTLVSFLQLRPSPMQRPAEVTASERVLKKSAIALSRVCGEENAARQIVELEGIERLAQLVRDPRERNYSDGVLVACLAALHKIATACGTDELDRRGASDLIENRLLDVFLEYSSRPESYV
ncbi:uncharacterized protein LOC130687404 [Daphnia carinata]|uniref:uncharacterized protein LOC130687404 n=1 Tax=Daphnia carinata TaxID=120202 RepID=UPI00257D7ED9|nr:uncharacterized protein LOC130687404 [Daphnia carinata]XP_059350866.1 uncharacterized protein LOC130687404 [Daphnia carinata]XP_059350867.1 uncharacterized protein LOC130687404 [Daphnia carinata]